MAKIDLKSVDLKELKVHIKSLNETGLLDPKIKIVGTSKENLVNQFADAVDALDEGGKDIPESVILFYNTTFPAEGATKAPAESPPDASTEAAPDAAKTETEEKEEKPKKKPPTPSKKITTFEDIKERLKTPANPTAYMDTLLLKGGKIETLIATLKEYLDENTISFSGFRTVSAVKRHIEYREEHGWTFTKDDDKVKLTGFTPKK